MKILCLSDLHLKPDDVIRAIDHRQFSPFLRKVQDAIAVANPDVIVITGDTVVPAQVRLLSLFLEQLCPEGIPIVLTLGNHEFWEHTFEETLQKLKEQYTRNPNIFFLDNIGAVEIGGMNFVGGTLFFDGSMRVRQNQKIDEWDGWQDWRIPDIENRYLEFNSYYIDMIRSKMKSGMSTVLCTHHVPHVRLNGHEPGHYSFYTGVQDLVHDLPFDPMYSNYLICGHTHRRVIGEVIPGFMGVNVGSEYGDLKTFLLEV